MLPGRVIEVACRHEIRIDHFVEDRRTALAAALASMSVTHLRLRQAILTCLKHTNGKLIDSNVNPRWHWRWELASCTQSDRDLATKPRERCQDSIHSQMVASCALCS
jgi:hypothetical protein